MISMLAFLSFLSLIVFGPKKTLEFAQEIGRLVARVKQATSQFESSMTSTAPAEAAVICKSVAPAGVHEQKSDNSVSSAVVS